MKQKYKLNIPETIRKEDAWLVEEIDLDSGIVELFFAGNGVIEKW